MQIFTHTSWSFDAIERMTAAERHSLDVKIDEMVQANKTDGFYEKEHNAIGPIIIRNWTSLDAAEEWKNFIESYNPIQTIIQEK